MRSPARKSLAPFKTWFPSRLTRRNRATLLSRPHLEIIRPY